MIENFDNYVYRGEAYQQWETSVDNKDEGIFLLNEEKFHNGSNVYAGSFTYKADMMMASYDIYTDVKAQGLNAIKFWIKDASVPNTNVSYFANYTGEDVSPTVVIQVVHKDGRWYRYTIDKAPRIWTEYTIPFSKFVLQPGTGVELDTSEPLISQNIINFAVGFQYYYKIKVNGQEVGYPLYTQNNPVYMDEIKFGSTSSSDAVITPLENALHPGEDKVTLIDNFEYSNTQELNNNWFCTKGYDYENITLSDEVTPEGGSHSMKLDYVKGANSPAYALYPTVGSDVEVKALQVDLKGDGAATIYINFYLYDNNTTHQYRATLTKFSSSWNRVTLGIGNTVFVPQDGGQALARMSLLKLQKITFGVYANGNGETSSILVDNMKFVVNKTETEEYAYGTNLITPIAMQ